MLALCVCSAVAIGGCGGSSSNAPGTYVKSVCTALAKWSSSIRAAGTQLQSSSTSATSLNKGKQQYLAFVKALVGDTDTAIGQLKKAGEPDVKRGKQISSELVKAFAEAKAGLSNAANNAAAIPTSGAAAYQAAASGVTTQIRQTLAQMANVQPERDPQLHSAAAKEPRCRSLRSSA